MNAMRIADQVLVYALAAIGAVTVFGLTLRFVHAFGSEKLVELSASTGIALSEDQIPRDHYRGLPPPEFRGDWSGRVIFVEDVKVHCGDDAYACLSHSLNAIIMPNPCLPDRLAKVGWNRTDGSMSMNKAEYTWIKEEYRTTMCHEIGHANGWPGNHWIATVDEIETVKQEMIERLYEDDQTYGGVGRDALLRWGQAGELGEAAIASLLADGGAMQINFKSGPMVRLTGCKYWTMREEREGDGAKLMAKHCPT